MGLKNCIGINSTTKLQRNQGWSITCKPLEKVAPLVALCMLHTVDLCTGLHKSPKSLTYWLQAPQLPQD